MSAKMWRWICDGVILTLKLWLD